MMTLSGWCVIAPSEWVGWDFEGTHELPRGGHVDPSCLQHSGTLDRGDDSPLPRLQQPSWWPLCFTVWWAGPRHRTRPAGAGEDIPLQVPRGKGVVFKLLTAGSDARLTALIPSFPEQAGVSGQDSVAVKDSWQAS